MGYDWLRKRALGDEQTGTTEAAYTAPDLPFMNPNPYPKPEENTTKKQWQPTTEEDFKRAAMNLANQRGESGVMAGIDAREQWMNALYEKRRNAGEKDVPKAIVPYEQTLVGAKTVSSQKESDGYIVNGKEVSEAQKTAIESANEEYDKAFALAKTNLDFYRADEEIRKSYLSIAPDFVEEKNDLEKARDRAYARALKDLKGEHPELYEDRILTKSEQIVLKSYEKKLAELYDYYLSNGDLLAEMGKKEAALKANQQQTADQKKIDYDNAIALDYDLGIDEDKQAFYDSTTLEESEPTPDEVLAAMKKNPGKSVDEIIKELKKSQSQKPKTSDMMQSQIAEQSAYLLWISQLSKDKRPSVFSLISGEEAVKINPNLDPSKDYVIYYFPQKKTGEKIYTPLDDDNRVTITPSGMKWMVEESKIIKGEPVKTTTSATQGHTQTTVKVDIDTYARSNETLIAGAEDILKLASSDTANQASKWVQGVIGEERTQNAFAVLNVSYQFIINGNVYTNKDYLRYGGSELPGYESYIEFITQYSKKKLDFTGSWPFKNSDTDQEVEDALTYLNQIKTYYDNKSGNGGYNVNAFEKRYENAKAQVENGDTSVEAKAELQNSKNALTLAKALRDYNLNSMDDPQTVYAYQKYGQSISTFDDRYMTNDEYARYTYLVGIYGDQAGSPARIYLDSLSAQLEERSKKGNDNMSLQRRDSQRRENNAKMYVEIYETDTEENRGQYIADGEKLFEELTNGKYRNASGSVGTGNDLYIEADILKDNIGNSIPEFRKALSELSKFTGDNSSGNALFYILGR